MSTYDDGESFNVDDVNLEDVDPEELMALQERFDALHEIENPIVKEQELQKLMEELNG